MLSLLTAIPRPGDANLPDCYYESNCMAGDDLSSSWFSAFGEGNFNYKGVDYFVGGFGGRSSFSVRAGGDDGLIAFALLDRFFFITDGAGGGGSIIRNEETGEMIGLSVGFSGSGEFRDLQATQTPEPATMLLLGTGLAGIGGVVRRRQGKNK